LKLNPLFSPIEQVKQPSPNFFFFCSWLVVYLSKRKKNKVKPTNQVKKFSEGILLFGK
jgi:hypothetical protein